MKSIEKLEDRRLFAFTLVGGVLTVTGTSGIDTIKVEPAAGGKLKITPGASLVTAASVTKIVVNSLAGNDTIFLNTLSIPATMNGAAGDDKFYCPKAATSVSGGDGNDTVFGATALKIAGTLDGGNDSFYGSNGNDSISTGIGNDSVLAELGNDTVDAGAGDDFVYADHGPTDAVANDNIKGGDGNDKLYATVGKDSLDGGNGNDALYGGGNDAAKSPNTLTGGAGNDSIYGGKGADLISAGAGLDLIFTSGDAQKDTVDGGADRDTLYGDAIDVKSNIP